MAAKILKILFIMVTLKGLLLGAYHLYLPTHWQWSKGLTEVPAILKWSLLALNDMWSALIILLHAALLYCFKAGFEKQLYQLGFFVAVYWLIHAVIISINPMPMPPQLHSLSMFLTAIPYIQFMVLALGSWSIRTRLLATT